jgi:hypothetical protein
MPPKPIQAHYRHGRWRMHCPKCGATLPAWEDGVVCPREHPGMMAKALQPIAGGLFRPVPDTELIEQARASAQEKGELYTPAFPAEREQIERILRLRPSPRNMNWDPTETVRDLLVQNIQHGDRIPDGMRVLLPAEES